MKKPFCLIFTMTSLTEELPKDNNFDVAGEYDFFAGYITKQCEEIEGLISFNVSFSESLKSFVCSGVCDD